MYLESMPVGGCPLISRAGIYESSVSIALMCQCIRTCTDWDGRMDVRWIHLGIDMCTYQK